jgi:ribosomal protein S18 acetylase RimI-like enzyme
MPNHPVTITIRPIRPEDAAAIAELHAEADDVRATQEQIAAAIAVQWQGERAFVAEQDGAVVGYACLRVLPNLFDAIPYAELSELYVAAAHRRSGIGRALLRHVEAEAQARGATQLVLLTAWRNTKAHTFYQSLGYSLYTITMRRSLEE